MEMREERNGSDVPTPTYYHQQVPMEGDGIPDGSILEWTAEDVAAYIASLGLGQYCDRFIEDEVSGAELISLRHEELQDLGVASVGHRIKILKSIYEIKIAHDVPIEEDNYVPLSADADDREKSATQHDIQRLIHIIRQRDSRIVEAEKEIISLIESLNKLKKDLLPVFRMVKNKSQELPPLSAESARTEREETRVRRGTYEDMDDQVLDPTPPATSNATLQPAPPSGRSLSRKFSMKKLILGTPKNASPTHPTHPDTEPPPTAQMNMNGAPQLPPISGPIMTPSEIRNLESHPSPTSPATIYHPSGSAAAYPSGGTPSNAHQSMSGSSLLGPSSHRPPDRRDEGSGGGSSVEIFKSFRVSMDDPCHKVLPAALKRYNIQADWRQYALYIVHGDQERCLGLDERPLILFKQLDRAGRKPMFMLRRNAGNGDTGGGIQVPGGVL